MAKKDYSEWSKEELIRELKKIAKQKKYGILWEDKPEQVALLCKEKLPVLAEDKNKEIKTDEAKPVNILIEGDNYHALSVLNYTHKGKIDVIYIDPPYNTGNGETFRFNDKIVDKTDSYRHSKWLSFMSKRLALVKSLLSNRGVIFISIDNNEFAQLKLLCDEIFGEENFESFIWRKKGGAGNTERIIGNLTEYILCYFKKKDKGVFNYRKIEREYKHKDNLGYYNLEGLEKTNLGDYERKTMQFAIIDPKTNKSFYPSKNMRWTIGEENAKIAVKEGKILFDYKKNKVYYVKRPEDYETSENVFYNLLLDVGSLSSAKDELNALLGDREIFGTPKPTSLIIHLLEIASKRNSVILDFFAGSGTTAHAVLNMNKEDGGTRKFILCTNNENNICTEVCYPRVKKVIQNLVKEANSKLVKNMPGNLKYFKTDFVDAEPTDRNKHKMVDKSTEMLCLKEDCFDEIMKWQSFRIFTNGQGRNLGIIYDDDGIVPFKKEAKKQKKIFVIYVFSLDESAREEEFEDVADSVELKPIPAVILNVYKRIFK